ncbi:MAG: hypothetical protein K2Y28_06070 [Burkholderiaceae bacterium]|nr:hypothetical protein [Burkholderiaceae bacterium]
MTIEKQFSEALRAAIEESRRIGYPPNRFETMLNEMGAIPLAKKLVKSSDLQTGLDALKKLGRPDLSLEHIMQKEEFKSLFSKTELEAAQWRLQSAH